MSEVRNFETECLVQLDLFRRVIDVVIASKNMGNVQIVIVDDDTEVIGRGAIGPSG